MASLIRDCRGRSPYWICCYNDADGRRLKKSTKQVSRTKALEMCLALEQAENLAGRSSLTEARARELISEVVERTTGEKLPFYSTEDWLKEWLRGKEVAKSAGTFVKYSSTVDGFLSHLGHKSKLSLAAITSKDISSFRDSEIASGKNPNTVHYVIKQLRIPFNAAKRQGILSHNPAEAVELPAKARNEDGGFETKDVFSPEQIGDLLNAASSEKNGLDWKGAIVFAYYTGARLHDVANTTWKGIDLQSRAITYRAKKTGRSVTIPLHGELEAHLLELTSPDNEKEFVFPSLAGKGSGGRSGLSMAFSRIMTKAKIEGKVVRKVEKGGKGRTVRSLTFHSLRHSFNSAMANAGVSQELRMKLTGHTSSDMNKGYTHLELEPLRSAIDVIPAILRKARE